MPDRPLLAPTAYAPAVALEIAETHIETIREIQAAVAAHDVVIVGMALNSHARDARRWLKAAGVPFHYLEYGGYLSQWRRRLAIKMWTGWATFPQVFVKGVLVGGSGGVAEGLKDGSITRALGR